MINAFFGVFFVCVTTHMVRTGTYPDEDFGVNIRPFGEEHGDFGV